MREYCFGGKYMGRMIPPLAQGRDCAMLLWATVGVSLNRTRTGPGLTDLYLYSTNKSNTSTEKPPTPRVMRPTQFSVDPMLLS